MDKKKVLIVEDEKEISKITRAYFERAGYEVYQAYDGEEALQIFKDEDFDLITLDIMIPKINGFEVLKIIRTSSLVPVIIISALDQEENILKGYELKVDDYMPKPFNPKILLAKANNLLNRLNNLSTTTEYKKGALTLNFETHTVMKDTEELLLSKTEFDLLSLLIKHEDRTCSRDMLLDEIWGLNSYVDNRIVDTYIKNIRKDLKPYNYIHTIYKAGYMFSLKENKNENE
ncbi:MAG: response regulator transcription factor [Acholeplasmatales bacterium]|nr:response regulator transcription factor [Acholeplasmatales bacterium]